MSDNTENPMNVSGDQQDGDASMPIQIHSQYVKDLSLENPNAPEIFLSLNKPPKIQVNVNVEARKVSDNNNFEVSLVVQADAKNEEGKTVFLAELTYAALVEIQNVPEETVKPVLLIEVPRLIFPYARNIISDITRDGGYPPLMINPVDFVSLYKQGMAQEAA